jgi:ribosome-associated protein
VARAAADKKAYDVSVLDMRKIPSVCDYFVIASGTSTTQVRAISDNIIDSLKEKGERVWHTEGEREALWILLDCGDVVAHIFQEDTRRFYELEKLWGKVPVKRFMAPARKKGSAKKAKKSRKASRSSKAKKPKKKSKRR